jgi:hypothetical protein
MGIISPVGGERQLKFLILFDIALLRDTALAAVLGQA